MVKVGLTVTWWRHVFTVSRILETIGMKSALARRFIVAGTWNLFGNGFSQAFALGAQIVVARSLGKIGFGELGAVYSTLMTAGVFCGLGLGLTATKHIAEFRDIDPNRSGRILRFCFGVTAACSIAIALCILFAARWISLDVLKEEKLLLAVRLGCTLVPLIAINALQISILAGFERFRDIAVINVGKGFCSLPLLILGARLGGVGGVIGAYVVLGGAICAACHVMIRKEVKRREIDLRSGSASSEARLLLAFSIPAFLNALTWPLCIWLMNLLVIRLPNGFEKMGLLNAARQWQAVTNFIPVALNGAIMPILASVLSTTPSDRDRSLRYANFLTQAAIWPITVVLMIGAPFFMGLYGRGYSSGWPIFVVLIGATAVNLINSPAGTLILAKGKIRVSLINTVASSIFVLGLLLLTIKRWELLSVVYVTLACNILSTVFIVLYSAKWLDLPSILARKMIVSAAGLTGLTLLLHWVYARHFF